MRSIEITIETAGEIKYNGGSKMCEKINRGYKDRLFRLVFEEKKDLLDLYNAVAQRQYEDPEKLEVTTLDNAIYMGMKNDISFLLSNVLNLYEHQSSFNPNMPVRGLGYSTSLYQKYIDLNGLNIYGTKMLKLPVPQYVVFYNGSQDEPDRMELKLSDSFETVETELEPSLECRATMLNINYGHNKELMDRSRRLRDYALFVFLVRENVRAGMIPEKAVDQVVTSCIRDGVLADVLSKHRAEVRNLMLYEYDEQKQKVIERNEAREEGRIVGVKDGIKEGKVQSVLEFLERLGNVPEEVYGRITGESDLGLLSEWLIKAARAETMQEFLESFP